MAEIISLAARRAARALQDGQDNHPRADVAADRPACAVLLFTGIRYGASDAPPGLVGRPWYTHLEPRDTAEPGTS